METLDELARSINWLLDATREPAWNGGACRACALFQRNDPVRLDFDQRHRPQGGMPVSTPGGCTGSRSGILAFEDNEPGPARSARVIGVSSSLKTTYIEHPGVLPRPQGAGRAPRSCVSALGRARSGDGLGGNRIDVFVATTPIRGRQAISSPFLLAIGIPSW